MNSYQIHVSKKPDTLHIQSHHPVIYVYREVSCWSLCAGPVQPHSRTAGPTMDPDWQPASLLLAAAKAGDPAAWVWPFFEALPLLLLSSGSAAGSSSRSKSSAADSIDANIAPGLLIFRPAPALPVLIRPLFRAYWMRVSRASVCVSLRVGARRPSVCVRRWRIKRRVTLKGSTCVHWKSPGKFLR